MPVCWQLCQQLLYLQLNRRCSYHLQFLQLPFATWPYTHKRGLVACGAHGRGTCNLSSGCGNRRSSLLRMLSSGGGYRRPSLLRLLDVLRLRYLAVLSAL